MSDINFHIITSLQDKALPVHHDAMVKSLQLCIKEEHMLHRELDAYDSNAIFPEDMSNEEASRMLGGYLQQGAGVLAITEGVLIGTGYLWMTGPNKCTIGPISVNKDCRGYGIGSKIVELLEREAMNRGCVAVNMLVLKNNPMLAKYNELGYKEESTYLYKALEKPEDESKPKLQLV